MKPEVKQATKITDYQHVRTGLSKTCVQFLRYKRRLSSLPVVMRQFCCGVWKISTFPNNRLSARWLRLTTMTRILYALPFIFKFGYPSEVYKRKALINWAAGTGPDYEMPSIFSREGGGVFLRICSGDVPSGTPNPDTISDQYL